MEDVLAHGSVDDCVRRMCECLSAARMWRSSAPTICLGSHQDIGLHADARANVVLLTYLLTYSLTYLLTYLVYGAVQFWFYAVRIIVPSLSIRSFACAIYSLRGSQWTVLQYINIVPRRINISNEISWMLSNARHDRHLLCIRGTYSTYNYIARSSENPGSIPAGIKKIHSIYGAIRELLKSELTYLLILYLTTILAAICAAGWF